MIERNLTKPQLQIRRLEQYLGPAACQLCGAVFFDAPHSTEELTDALNQLREKNDALRIVPDPDDGNRQLFRAYQPVDVPVLSFPSEADYRRYTDDYRVRAMDSTNSLFECAVVHLPDRDGVLFKAHHMIADAWSLALLACRLQELLEGKALETHSYADFATREQQRLVGPKYRQDEAFFRERLEKHSGRIQWKGATVSPEADCLICPLERTEMERIRAYTEERETTLPVFFLTILALGLYRLGGRPESFYVGVPVLNRTDATDFRTVGMFVNTVPVLLQPDEHRSFRDNLIQTVEDSWFQTLRHQRYNYTELMEAVGRKAEHLYDVLLSFHTEQLPEGICSFEQYGSGLQAESLQIHIENRLRTGDPAVRYEFREALFTPEEIRRFHDFLHALGTAALADDSRPVSDLYRDADQSLQLPYGPVAATEPLSRETVAELFDRKLQERPDAICLLTAERPWTRGEFRNGILKIDRILRTMVAGRNQPVAVLFERGPAMYMALYGILRAGHAFVPMDPGNPPERLRYLLEDSGAVLLLTDGFPDRIGLPVPVVNPDTLPPREPDEEVPPPAARPEDIAYILYTSGSTGAPKGVAIRHESLRNRLDWMQKYWALGPNSVILQKTPYTFDVSIWEIFWWGMVGGKMAFSRPGEHFLPEAVADVIRNCRVTHIHFVPTVFGLFLSWLENHPERCPDLASLEHVFLSGEALSAGLVNRFRCLAGSKPAVHNLYGPTECTIDVTCYDCRERESDPVPIGKPVERTIAYVVDELGRPVPPGVPGELWIGGIQVGEGYVNRLELTAERFVPNPFGDGRVYKTGDLVSLREDGQLLYHGRNDTQFKLNGQRMEAGEIEAVIREHPTVADAVVQVERQGERELLTACYCGTVLTPAELRRHCLQRLPAAMVPVLWYRVREIPLTAAGKADRAALRMQDRELCETSGSAAPPVNEEEARICRRFSEILGTEINDRHADFLLYGGGSMDVIRLLSEENPAGVTAAEFMADPTPAGLAARLREKRSDAPSSLLCLYPGVGAGQAVILFPYAGGTAAGYTALCSVLRETAPDTAVFFVPFPHTMEDCLAVAGEIEKMAEAYRLTFYAHCVGAAPALRIIAELERRGVNDLRLTAGGLIPPGRHGFCPRHPWRPVPDAVLKRLLRRAGAPAAFLEANGAADFLSGFRADTDFYAEILRGNPVPRVQCPVRLLLAGRDPFTKNLPDAERRWAFYCSGRKQIILLDTNNHYFQTTMAATVGAMILKSFDEEI